MLKFHLPPYGFLIGDDEYLEELRPTHVSEWRTLNPGSFFTKIFFLTGVGFLLTGIVAYVFFNADKIYPFLTEKRMSLFAVLLDLLVFFFLARKAEKISFQTGIGLYIINCIFKGIYIAGICNYFDYHSFSSYFMIIGTAFFIASFHAIARGNDFSKMPHFFYILLYASLIFTCYHFYFSGSIGSAILNLIVFMGLYGLLYMRIRIIRADYHELVLKDLNYTLTTQDINMAVLDGAFGLFYELFIFFLYLVKYTKSSS